MYCKRGAHTHSIRTTPPELHNIVPITSSQKQKQQQQQQRCRWTGTLPRHEGCTPAEDNKLHSNGGPPSIHWGGGDRSDQPKGSAVTLFPPWLGRKRPEPPSTSGFWIGGKTRRIVWTQRTGQGWFGSIVRFGCTTIAREDGDVDATASPQ